MEPKKNPKYDVNRYRPHLFSIGLICSFTIVIMAFQWKAELTNVKPPKPLELGDEITYVVPTTAYEQPKSEKQIVRVQFPANFTETIEPDIPESNEPIVTVDLTIIAIPQSALEVPSEAEEIDIIHIGSEIAPEPVGGYNNFYDILKKNMKYPRPAQQKSIQGRVYVQFVVGKNGELTDMRVIKGIGGGCDEEAMRVIKLAKWNPGKQRGVPVRVRMTQPIIFQLN
jgi:protein TonB